jgi:hypothetical protein
VKFLGILALEDAIFTAFQDVGNKAPINAAQRDNTVQTSNKLPHKPKILYVIIIIIIISYSSSYYSWCVFISLFLLYSEGAHAEFSGGVQCLFCSNCVTSCGHVEPTSHRNLTVAGGSTDFPRRQPFRVWSDVRHRALFIQNHHSIWEKSELFQALAQESSCIQDTLILQIK